VKVIDVHPEELLDRELRGVLSDEQRVLLDLHLARCESCRLERLLRADFAADAARTGDADMQSFVLGALQRVASVEAASVPLVSPLARPRARFDAGNGVQAGARRRWSTLLAVACVLLVATGAAASRSAWVERIYRITFGEVAIDEARPARDKHVGARAFARESSSASAGVRAAAAAERQTSSATGRAASATLAAADTESTAAAESPGPVVRSNATHVQRPARERKGSAPRALYSSYRAARRTARITNVSSAPLSARAPEGALRPAAAAPTSQVLPAPAAAAPTPEQLAQEAARVAQQAAATALFEQANQARRQGRLEPAATLYEKLQREYAGSSEARLSHAISGRMWLDAGNAFAAEGAFERYLATGDRALREEAMTGRALSLERLGRKAAADAAFAELLQAYPYSSYAPLAKKRLGQDDTP
jgi:hypothetical protein